MLWVRILACPSLWFFFNRTYKIFTVLYCLKCNLILKHGDHNTARKKNHVELCNYIYFFYQGSKSLAG